MANPKRRVPKHPATAVTEPGPVVVIDTREQIPYAFARSVVGTLATGDYSLVGLEDRVTVERKTKIDAYGTIGRGRERFTRELARMAMFEYAAIVIECSLAEMLVQPSRSRLSPRAAVRSLVSWSVRYRVHVFFADDRAHGEALTAVILEKFWKHQGGSRHVVG